MLHPTSILNPTSLALALTVASCFILNPGAANPTGAVAIHGQAALSNPQANTLLITTQNGPSTKHSAINWQSFSVPAGNTTRFVQPDAGSTSINRVVTNTPSLLFGNLSSNGKLVLVNQSGIAVGAGALVDTAGFTASSVGMSELDAIAGSLRFGGAGPGESLGALGVQGHIVARGGDVVLIAPSLELAKTALVESEGGAVILAAGQRVAVTGRGLEGISMEVQAPTDKAVNLGTLKGDAVGVFAGQLRHSGLIQASQANMEGGRVVLKAAGDVFVEGEGKILANGSLGGQVDVLGQRVALTDRSLIDVSGARGGGRVRVGGDYQGQNPSVPNARITYFGQEASINANASDQGDGGRVIVWADDTTRAYGNISARGGELGGSGGFVETSGHRYLDFQGRVDTRAPRGKVGTLLLDPSDITIDNSADSLGGGSLGAGAFTGGTANAVLTWSTIDTQLGLGNLELRTNSAATSGQGDILITASKALTSSNTLTLLANRHVVFSPSVTVSGTGDINLVAGWNNTGWAVTPGVGDVSFGSFSNLSTSGNLYFNAGNSVVQSAGSMVTANTLTIGNSAGGALPGGISMGQLNMVNTLAVQIDSGPLSFVNGQALTIGPGAFSIDGIAAALNLNPITVATTSGGLTLAKPISSSGALTLMTTNSPISQTPLGVVAAGGTTTINAGSGGVSLNNTSNDFGFLTVSGTGVVDVADVNDIFLSNVSAASFKLKTGGIITATQPIATSAGAIDIASTGGSISSSQSFSALGGPVKLDAGTGLTLSGAGGVSSNAFGDAVELVSNAGLLSVAGPVSTPNGRWLSYVKDPGSHVFPTGATFKQYNAPYGATVLGSGNGQLYNNTVPPILTTTLAGSVSKIYDGSTSISLAGSSFGPVSGGAIDGDVVTGVSLASGLANLASPSVGSGIVVTASGMTVTGVTSSVATGSMPVYGYQAAASGPIGSVTPAVIYTIGLSGSRLYDGTSVVDAGIFTLGGLIGGETLTLFGSGNVVDKNVGVNKPVFLGSLTLGDGTGLASNYTLAGGTHVATIKPRPLTSVSGVKGIHKVYDGGVAAMIDTSAATLSGVLGSDSVLAAGGTAAFSDRNVGVGKAISVTALDLSGADGGNYVYAGGATTQADISVRPMSIWTGAVDSVWGNPGNWDALPDGNNVLAVTIPVGKGRVVYDKAMGTTTLQSLSSALPLALTGGTLHVSGPVVTAGYEQTGGHLMGSGGFRVDGAFVQNGGSIAMASIDIRQAAGNVVLGDMTASSIVVQAGAGAIQQLGPLTANELKTASTAGALLTDAGNRVGSFLATNDGAGDVALVNTGPLVLSGIVNRSGSIRVDNTGAIVTQGPIRAPDGRVAITANSPLTIGAGGVLGGDDVDLAATNRTSVGDLTLHGDVVSIRGVVTLSAGHSLTQNSAVTAAGGVTATAGVSMTYGPLATAALRPVSYSVAGRPVAPPPEPYVTGQPPPPDSPTGQPPSPESLAAGHAGDFVLGFLDRFDQAVHWQHRSDDDSVIDPRRRRADERNPIVAEGEICRP